MNRKNRTLCFLTRGNPPNEVLLGLKKSGFGAGKYAGFGGGVEVGETVEFAAVREVEEETGIKLSISDIYKIGQLTFLFPSKPAWSQTVHVFLTKTWEGTPMESDEMKPVWYAFNTIPFENMWDDARYWLPDVLEAKHVKASFVYEDDLATVGGVEFEPWYV